MEKLQEAAEEFILSRHQITRSEIHPEVITDFVDFHLQQSEHSKEVIEELVKALEEARATFRVLGLHQEADKYNELIQKHRNNEK